MMKKLTLLAGLMTLASTATLAQTSGNYPIKDANSAVRQRAAASLSDGSLADKHVLVDSSGVEKGTSANPVNVGGTVIVGTSALPTGAATATGVAAVVTALGSPLQAGGSVSVTASALPTGAATAAAQATGTAAITATQAATGVLAATSTTVTTTLPQISATAGLAVSFGTTAATLFNANASRHFVQIQVQGSTGGCYINGTSTATADANSLYLVAGSYFESATHVGTGAISIICTTAATPVYSRQG